MSNMLAFSDRVEARGGEQVLRREWMMAGHDETYRERDLAIYLAARFLSEAAALAQSVAIGWTVYALSNAPLALASSGSCNLFRCCCSHCRRANYAIDCRRGGC